ncbi:MAG: hypothetical protein ACREEM_29410 [Blastocatellia bacterium]
MNRKVILFAMLIILMMATSFAQDTTARRVKFQRGRSSALVNGTVKCGSTVTYLIGAKAGQKMKLHISGRATFKLSTPTGEPLQGGKAVSNATEELEENGDYKVEVECWKQSSASYSLEVIIQ